MQSPFPPQRRRFPRRSTPGTLPWPMKVPRASMARRERRGGHGRAGPGCAISQKAIAGIPTRLVGSVAFFARRLSRPVPGSTTTRRVCRALSPGLASRQQFPACERSTWRDQVPIRGRWIPRTLARRRARVSASVGRGSSRGTRRATGCPRFVTTSFEVPSATSPWRAPVLALPPQPPVWSWTESTWTCGVGSTGSGDAAC